MEPSFMQRYGYALAFGVAFAEFAGVPVPSAAVLLFAGAVAAASGLSVPTLALAAAAGALAADTLWFFLGRRSGRHLIRLYCTVTLSSGACAHTTEEFFRGFGARSLAVAKFVPGLSALAAPMAGHSGVTLPRFLVWSGLGALGWAGAFVFLGHWLGLRVFYEWVARADRMGGTIFWGAVAVLAAYLAMKVFRRMRHGVATDLPPAPPPAARSAA